MPSHHFISIGESLIAGVKTADFYKNGINEGNLESVPHKINFIE
jgi:hypothetical protein